MKSNKIYTLLCLLLMIYISAGAQEKGYVIDGIVKGIRDQKVMLTTNGPNDANEVLQTVQMVNGKFTFKGHLQTPPAILDVKFEDGQYWLHAPKGFFLPSGCIIADNGQNLKLEISVDPQHMATNAGYIYPEFSVTTTYPAFVEMTRVNEELTQKFDKVELKALDDLSSFINDTLKITAGKENESKLSDDKKRKLADVRLVLRKKVSELGKARLNYYTDYIKIHPNSPVSILLGFKSRYNPSVTSLLESITPNLKSSSLYSTYLKEVNTVAVKTKMSSETVVGAAFKDFTLQDVNGKDVKLSSLLKDGEYVFLDFWASWCAPCRAENPNVLKAYNKFHEKGLKVVAVSLDRSKQSWLKAIKDDGMPWIHISDLKEWNSDVVKQYGINAIPANFLLDGKGKIVARGLHGENLHSFLEEILGKR